jgi:prolycopene isomerase
LLFHLLHVTFLTTFLADYAIPGLSFCGGHYIRGDGYSCAYIMGDTVAKKVVKRLKGGA